MAVEEELNTGEEQEEKKKGLKIDLSREIPKKAAILAIAGVVVMALVITTLVLWLAVGRRPAAEQPQEPAEPSVTTSNPAAAVQETPPPLPEPETPRNGAAELVEDEAIRLLPVRIADQWGFINLQGQLAIEAGYEEAAPFQEGLSAVRINGSVGYINSWGEMVIPPGFEEGMSFHEGMAAVQLNRLWGFVNQQGQLVIEAQYDDAWHFSEGFAAVSQNGRWGYLGPAGSWAIQPLYDRAWPFYEGIAQVEMNERTGYIDQQGEWVWDPRFRQ